MGESLRSAWAGWMGFADRGKLAALLLVLCCYLLLGKKRKGPQGRLILYGSIAAVLCICPVTAAALMKYQTLFYGYPWIWSIVPLTATVALGGTLFLTEQWKTGAGYRTLLYNATLTILCAGVLVLCGGLGAGRVNALEERAGRERAEEILRAVEESCGTDCCLWAPREILEYARVREGAPRLLYGRNMWDAALNAYSYDTYSEEVREMYLWMEHLTDYGTEISEREGYEFVAKAVRMGVDCILLPTEMKGWDPTDGKVESADGSEAWSGKRVEMIELDGYYLLRMR